MNTLEKIVNVLVRNLEYTVVLILSVVLFTIFSEDWWHGAITAMSALVACACVAALYRAYKSTPQKSKRK